MFNFSLSLFSSIVRAHSQRLTPKSTIKVTTGQAIYQGANQINKNIAAKLPTNAKKCKHITKYKAARITV